MTADEARSLTADPGTASDQRAGSIEPGPLDYLRVLPQYIWPQHLLSALMFRATRIRWRWYKNKQIRWFIRRYQVDMPSAAQSEPDAYVDFNSFFTRGLRPGARPLERDDRSIVSPADGCVSQAGTISGDRLVQAKGREFTITRLLGGDEGRAAPFVDGGFITVYLSPRDYHRVHMPAQGTLREMIYIPGRLFSVNPRTTRVVDALFARNERVVSVFDGPFGPFAVVLVGAVFVGSIETTWAGMIAPPRSAQARTWSYPEPITKVRLTQGEEMGRFNMGSTVIVLLPASARFTLESTPGQLLRVGQRIARRESPAPSGSERCDTQSH